MHQEARPRRRQRDLVVVDLAGLAIADISTFVSGVIVAAVPGVLLLKPSVTENGTTLDPLSLPAVTVSVSLSRADVAARPQCRR